MMENRESKNEYTKEEYTKEELAVMQKLRAAAEKEEIPPNLAPEIIKQRLEKTKGKASGWPVVWCIGAAAAILLVAVGFGSRQGLRKPAGDSQIAWSTSEEHRTEPGAHGSGGDTDTPKPGSPVDGETIVHHPNAGAAYQLASDLASIRDRIGTAGMAGIYDVEEEVSPAAPSDAAANDAIQLPAAEVTETPGGSYSTTNLQTEGVDESDLVKTDGRYIYRILQDRIQIIDIRGERMEIAATICPELGENAVLRELYLDGDHLCVFATEWETLPGSGWDEVPTDLVVDDCIELWGATFQKYRTTALVYRISDRSAPTLLAAYTQDGRYHTSRKVGKEIYLFTEMHASLLKSEEEDRFPQVNGHPVSEKNIYVETDDGSEHAKKLRSGLLISSFRIDEPSQTVDHLMIAGSGSAVYVGKESVYLYHTVYSDQMRETPQTVIAKFSYRDGILNGEASTAVDGYVMDVFAVSEKDGKLRMLTTCYSNVEKITNRLTLFDEKLEMTGEITGIAPGEQIYAARYLGDMAYFITYRNMDPLFAADLSDPANPILLGSLEITGFSDYLHPYGDGLLLGIGYETDPEDGRRKGLKLVMFDVSDPTAPKTLSCLLPDAYGSVACEDYKVVLADPGKNLIGLPIVSESRETYQIYRWSGTEFELLSETDFGEDSYYVRGLYADDRFYISSLDGIVSLDLENGCRKLEQLSFNK